MAEVIKMEASRVAKFEHGKQSSYLFRLFKESYGYDASHLPHALIGNDSIHIEFPGNIQILFCESGFVNYDTSKARPQNIVYLAIENAKLADECAKQKEIIEDLRRQLRQ